MKRTRHLVDPELRDYFDWLPDIELNDQSLHPIRDFVNSATPPLESLPNRIERSEIFFPGVRQGVSVRSLLYQPKEAENNNAAYLHIHGGGMVLGSADNSDRANVELCCELGITILSVDYRLAPEHPYPAALLDCYAGLAHLHKNASELNIDKKRIAVGGESAGGGLAASLAIYARNLAEYPICHQQLVFPMLDDRTGMENSLIDENLGEYCWTPEANSYGWNAYLGTTNRNEATIPARTEDLVGLPPAWIGVGDFDLFLNENKTYARRLNQEGIASKIMIYHGAPHGFTAVLKSKLYKQFKQDFNQALSSALSLNISKYGGKTN